MDVCTMALLDFGNEIWIVNLRVWKSVSFATRLFTRIIANCRASHAKPAKRNSMDRACINGSRRPTRAHVLYAGIHSKQLTRYCVTFF